MEAKLEPLVFDESTGLPKLPEQYAWKVEDFGQDDKVWVRIYEKKEDPRSFLDKLFKVKPNIYWEISWRFMNFHETCSADRECIKQAAVMIYNEARKRELDREAVTELVGLYPPKSL